VRLIDADDLINTLGISNNDIYCEETIEEYILDNGTLSFTEPERKKGQWIDNTFCSECGWVHEVESGFIGSVEQFNFCPNCGADMRGEQNDTD